MHEQEETVKIFTLEREHEAVFPLIEEAFAREGIAMRFQSKFDTAYDGIFVPQKGLGHIYVFKKDRDKALALLKNILKENRDYSSQ